MAKAASSTPKQHDVTITLPSGARPVEWAKFLSELNAGARRRSAGRSAPASRTTGNRFRLASTPGRARAARS